MQYRIPLMLSSTLLLLACAKAPEPPAPEAKPAMPSASAAATAPAPTPAPEASVQAMDKLLDDYLSAWNAHDIPGAGSYLDEGVLYLDVSVGEVQRGRQAAEDNVIGVLMRAMPDLEWTLRGDPIIQGNGIAYEWQLTGTNTGTWAGIPASQQKVNIKGGTIMRVKDGKIFYQADYYDVASLNRQLGW
ncbi:ester cyclase [Arenimonas sp.]|uniref:ester cyclase n=1 Tax=Arenimonas sp. TaxID=1872635 RepID=UPI0039E68FDF